MMFVTRHMFSVISVCSNSQPHRCMGNHLSMPARIAMKWFLNVCIAFLAAF